MVISPRNFILGQGVKKEFIVHSSKVSTSTENLVSIPLSLDYDGLSLAKDDKEIPSSEALGSLKLFTVISYSKPKIALNNRKLNSSIENMILQVVAGKLFYKASLFILQKESSQWFWQYCNSSILDWISTRVLRILI